MGFVVFNSFFFKFLTPFTLGGCNFLISNLFSTIFCVLNVPRGGVDFFLDTRSNRALPWLVYSNTIVAPNVQLGWFMRFAMECFNPYLLASNSIWVSI